MSLDVGWRVSSGRRGSFRPRASFRCWASFVVWLSSVVVWPSAVIIRMSGGWRSAEGGAGDSNIAGRHSGVAASSH